MKLQKSIKAVIRDGEQKGYVAECLEIPVVTQGDTLDELVSNLKEAVELFLDGEDNSEFGLDKDPNLIVTMEIEPAHA